MDGLYLSTPWRFVATLQGVVEPCQPSPYSPAFVKSKNSQVSHSTTATAHRIAQDKYILAELYASVVDFVIIC